jgi:pimeloyl-ACP methyl ester carboxylesterase
VRPKSDEVVVLVHGIFRSRYHLKRLEEYLDEHGYETVALTYPSTAAPVEAHAEQLARVIDRIDGARTIHIVAHSLGGLVVRAYLRGHRDPRIRRVVMLGTPNRGSELARRLADLEFPRWIIGPVGEDLVRSHEDLLATFPAPWCEFGVIAAGTGGQWGWCEFGVIAAGTGGQWGWSPLITGDDDALVGVEETPLEGMQDHLFVRAMHTWMMNKNAVQQAVLDFLRTGCFIDISEAESRRPGEKDCQ